MAQWTSEMLVTYHGTTWHHSLEGLNLNIQITICLVYRMTLNFSNTCVNDLNIF